MTAPPPFLTPAFLTAAAANFLFFANLSAFFLLPLHLGRLGVGEAGLGLIMGLYSATAIVCQPLVGAWVDRAGRRPFLLAGAALGAAASLGFAGVPATVALFPVFRILQGLAYSLYFVALFALVVDLVPPARRGQALGAFGISGLASAAVGPALGEVVVRKAGFRAFFAAAGLVGLGALAVSARVPAPPAARPAPGPNWLRELALELRVVPRGLLLQAFAFGLGVGGVFTFVPPYAARLGAEPVGLFAVAYSLAAAGVRAGGGQWIDRLGPGAVIRPALALQAASAAGLGALALLPPVAALGGLLAAGLVGGVAHGFLYPALSARVVDLTPEARRGRAIGVFSACILAGNAAGAMGFGPVARGIGSGPMFALLGSLLAGAALLARRPGRPGGATVR